ncbi:hypothetical protein RHOER0001_5301 [Rhodococcus erythropolis SK121]|nr:hypothetical protein RHOER0001_5301 [Rhodococcus erythropolis SK121]
MSPSPGLYDSNGNILQPAEDRGVDTGLTADYRETISKIGLSEKDVSYKTDRTFIFEEVNGTKCELVLTRQGEGLETQYIAALQLADGSGFGLNAAAMKSKAQFEQALTNSGC